MSDHEPRHNAFCIDIATLSLSTLPAETIQVLGRGILHEFAVEADRPIDDRTDHAGRLLDRFQQDLADYYRTDPIGRFAVFHKLAMADDVLNAEVGIQGAQGFVDTPMEYPMLATLAQMGMTVQKQALVRDILDLIDLSDESYNYFEAQAYAQFPAES